MAREPRYSPPIGGLSALVALAAAASCSVVNSADEPTDPGAGGGGTTSTSSSSSGSGGGQGGQGGQGGGAVEPLMLASSQDHPYGVAADGTHVYWTTFGDGSSATGSVKRVPVSGNAVEDLAGGLAGATEIVVDDANAYWITIGASGPNGGVWRLPKNGGTPTELVSGYSQVYDLVVLGATNPARVYYTCGQCDGGAPGRVEWVPVDGGTPTVVADNQAEPVSITAAGSAVFWVNRDGQQVFTADTGGTVNELSTAADAADGITAAEGQLFWTASTEDTVYRMPATGGTVEQLAAGSAYGFGIAADLNHVYFVAGPAIMKVPTSAGEAAPHVSDQNLPFQVAIDGTNVYWTDYAGGTVMQAPK